ncbi:hypothetical protein BDA99DRAFT_606086 [Phascolomyces articulosus]|uniref:N-acetyltransferase domain-containing protein n=1 Tax=Phascolomyces articulosus TaxID=60185 RepID=A0AAD5JX63_9FUNG|nr:hypothetical protein BDA99DRAFT_606086 [Phascolomyces articulosus]
MIITKRVPTSQQQRMKHMVLKDHIYLRPVMLDDLQRAEEIASVINTSYTSDDGWTSITSFVHGSRVTSKDMVELIHDTVNYDKTKTMFLCVVQCDPTTQQESAVIGTFLIQGGGEAGKGSIFPAIVQRSDTPTLTKQEQQIVKENECCLRLFCILPKYQSHGLGGRLQRAGFLYARDILGYPYAIVWVFEHRTPALLASYRKIGWQMIGTMAHPKPQCLKDKSTRYLLLKNDLKLVKSVL